MNRINHIAQGDFEKEVVHSNLPVLIDFWAPWCGPCRAMATALSQAHEGQLQMAKINVDEEPKLAEQFRISSIPTLVLFRDGKEIDRSIGAQGRSSLEKFLQAVLN